MPKNFPLGQPTEIDSKGLPNKMLPDNTSLIEESFLSTQSCTIPDELQFFQEEFGKSLSTPIDFSSGKFRFQSELYPEAIQNQVLPSKLLSGVERLTTYNQQFWYRHFTLLQNIFPLLRHLLGLWHFNQLISVYLTKHSSNTYQLQKIAEKFIEFLKSSDTWNKPQYIQSATLELWYDKTFFYNYSAPLELEQFSPSQTLYLQSHVFLFFENWNIVESFFLALDDPQNKTSIDLVLNQQHWLLSKPKNEIKLLKLSSVQYKLISKFKKGKSLNEACESLLKELGRSEKKVVEANLQNWFQQWYQLNLFQSKPQ